MSRTQRTEPRGCWMRNPRGKVAVLRHIEATAGELHDAGYTRTRKAVPPDDWDDLPVSYVRGQAWSHKRI